jgi:hypothetical protein
MEMELRSIPLSPGSSNCLLVLSRVGSEVMLHSITGMLILADLWKMYLSQFPEKLFKFRGRPERNPWGPQTHQSGLLAEGFFGVQVWVFPQFKLTFWTWCSKWSKRYREWRRPCKRRFWSRFQKSTIGSSRYSITRLGIKKHNTFPEIYEFVQIDDRHIKSVLSAYFLRWINGLHFSSWADSQPHTLLTGSFRVPF